jgi:hypothetical protein
MYLPISWRKSICGWEGEVAVRGDTFKSLEVNALDTMQFAFPERRSRSLTNHKIYKVNLPSFVIDAVADQGSKH